jgi:hypothetical protein
MGRKSRSCQLLDVLWSGLSGSKTFRRVSGTTERITVSLDAGVAAGLKAAAERGWRS